MWRSKSKSTASSDSLLKASNTIPIKLPKFLVAQNNLSNKFVNRLFTSSLWLLLFLILNLIGACILYHQFLKSNETLLFLPIISPIMLVFWSISFGWFYFYRQRVVNENKIYLSLAPVYLLVFIGGLIILYFILQTVVGLLEWKTADQNYHLNFCSDVQNINCMKQANIIACSQWLVGISCGLGWLSLMTYLIGIVMTTLRLNDFHKTVWMHYQTSMVKINMQPKTPNNSDSLQTS